jgi:transposase
MPRLKASSQVTGAGDIITHIQGQKTMYRVNLTSESCTKAISPIDWVKTSLVGIMHQFHSPGITPTEVATPHVEAQRLGVLPILRHFFQRLKVREIIDRHSPKPDSEVSNGECVEAMVMALFLDKEHALSRVRGLLEGYDVEGVFRPGVTASHFHDTRLGECLDDLYDLAPTMYGDIVASAIKEFQLVIKRLNLDATKILLHGDYACFEDYMAHAVTIAFPERGWNPENRWDLKQLLFELVVTEEKIPLLYAMGDGNASETSEYLKIMRRLDTIQADLSKAVLVADCKMCAAATLREAAAQQLRLVTLLPESFGLRQDLIRQASNEAETGEELRLLLTTDEGEEYRGRSFRVPFLVDFVKGDVIETKTVWWRYLIVHSSQKAQLAKESRERGVRDERESLDRDKKKYQAEKLFACEADAKQEGEAWIKRRKLAHHRVTCTPIPGVIRKGCGRRG